MFMNSYVNNHIHTTYSFSPYSPSEAVYRARSEGLATAGIMDHDTVAGASEFVRAGAEAGVAVTVGLECRCSMSGTPFDDKRFNNPDQKSVAYLAMHGIPRCRLDTVQNFITPYREARNTRNRVMAGRLDDVFAPFGIRLDFDKDVVPISMAQKGGAITERHLLYALAGKLIGHCGAGAGLIEFLEGSFGVVVSGSAGEKLSSRDTPFYQYHLLGLLKASFMDKFYIDAHDELPHFSEFIRIALDNGAIPAYAYLGDVSGSVTGDKKDAEFEDAYLDDFIAWLPGAGFLAVTYMPARNTPKQLARIAALCGRHNLFQISGEDINSPFQSFVCPALEDPRHARLIEATWALIGHEHIAADDPSLGMFMPRALAERPGLADRISHYAGIGRKTINEKGLYI